MLIAISVLSCIAILHGSKFSREARSLPSLAIPITLIRSQYEAFWKDPSQASFIWISLLFSAMYIGADASYASGQEVLDDPDGQLRTSFFSRAGQALVTGKYHKARSYSVEAILLYASCCYRRNSDADVDAWMIMGIGARLALKMGYHRDPRHFANVTPFEGEMRRRVFSIVAAFELLLSFQAGMPEVVRWEECDTELPRNLFDTDFDEDCKVLPTSRPPTDPTPMLYWCYKGQLSKLFQRVARHALSIGMPPYAEIMELDRELRATYESIPPPLRMKPLGSAFTDDTHVILQRLNVEVVYLKSVCVLHRRYISQERSNSTFHYSRKACIDSALKLLEHQAQLHFACQPGGQLYHDRWMPSSLLMHDFLLVAMVICLDLYECCKQVSTPAQEDINARDKKYAALKLSYEIWRSRKETSKDARRASNVLAKMLLEISKASVPTSNLDQLNLSQIELVELGGADSSSSSSWSRVELGTSTQDSCNGRTTHALPNHDPFEAVFQGSNDVDWVSDTFSANGFVQG